MLTPFPQQPSSRFAGRRVLDSLSQHEVKAIPKPLQTVLLVDDDDDLREVMEACLGMMGYVIRPCRDAEIASETFRSTSIDFLLTDLQMPGRSGVELARELTQLSPTLPVMIVSGSILSDELLDEIQRRKWKFLAKPCRMAQLVGTIQTLLAPGSHATAR